MSWTIEHVDLLIQEYEKYPQLYHISHPQYFNKIRRSVYLERIASALSKIRPNTTNIEVQKKITGLRNTYASERKKYLDSLEKGEHVYTPSLWYYEKLEFLNTHLGARKAKSNLTISQQPEFVNMAEENESRDTDFDSTSEDELKFPSDPFVEDLGATALVQGISISEAPLPMSTRKKLKYSEEAQPSRDVKHPTSTRQPIDEDLVYCRYLASRLAGINNSRRKLLVKHKIDNLLYEAMAEEYS